MQMVSKTKCIYWDSFFYLNVWVALSMFIATTTKKAVSLLGGYRSILSIGAIQCILAKFQFKNYLKISLFIAATKKITVTWNIINTIELVFFKKKTV